MVINEDIGVIIVNYRFDRENESFYFLFVLVVDKGDFVLIGIVII